MTNKILNCNNNLDLRSWSPA